MFAVWAGDWDFFVMAAGVTEKLEAVSVESEGEEAVWTECLPAAVTADSERSGATTIMENKSLEFLLKTVLDRVYKLIANKAMASEALAVLKVYELDVATSLTFDGEFV